MPGSPAGWKVELSVAQSLVDATVAVLESLVEAVTVTLPSGAGDVARITAFGTIEPDTDAIRRAVSAVAGPELAVDVTWLPTLDWVAENQATFRPIRVGRFFVRDSAYAGPVPPAAIALVIDATSAFGTGAHATTAGCLAALDRLARRPVHGPVLDLGCGTGVLALAAARRLRCPVVVADCDPEAVRIAAHNARRNGVMGLVTVIRSDGYADVRMGGPYGLILANILARPLAALAPGLCRHLRPGGRAVLSGLLAAQERQVLVPHLVQGLCLERRLVIDGWATLVLRRPSGQPSRGA